MEGQIDLDTNRGPADLGPPGGELDDAMIRQVVDAAPDGIVVADDRGVIRLVNTRVEELFGYTRAELLGRPVECLVPNRFRGVHEGHRAQYRTDASPRPMGARTLLYGRRQDTSEFPVEISLSPIWTGETLQIVAAIRDISERIAIEAHARRIQQVLDATNDAVYIFGSSDPRLVYVNQGAVAQVGYSSTELADMTLSDLTPELSASDLEALLDSLDPNAGSLLTRTASLRRKDGRDIPVEIVIQTLTVDRSDASPTVVAIARDIGDRLDAEARDRERDRELQVLEDRERIARDLHDLVIQRLFAAGMSAQSLHARLSDPALADRASGIVDALDATISEIRTTIFGLQQPMGGTAGFRERLMAVIEEQRVHLGFPPHVYFDGPLESFDEMTVANALAILREALSNVARHAEASSVEITVLAHDELVIRVVDDGRGLRSDPGTGHGIVNMTERVRELDGTFELRSGADGGTHLECRLPIVAA
ncbi:MAG: PAS domain S-box protein [Acidimicrobiia bacterium]